MCDAVGDRGAGGLLGGEQGDDRDGLVAVRAVPDCRRGQWVDVAGGRWLRAGRKGSGMFAETSCSFFVASPVALPFRLATAFGRGVDLAESGVGGEEAVADWAGVCGPAGGSASVGRRSCSGESSSRTAAATDGDGAPRPFTKRSDVLIPLGPTSPSVMGRTNTQPGAVAAVTGGTRDPTNGLEWLRRPRSPACPARSAVVAALRCRSASHLVKSCRRNDQDLNVFKRCARVWRALVSAPVAHGACGTR